VSAAVVVGSSGWLEYLAGSSRADLYASAIEDTDNLLVPVTSIYEVFKKVLREAGEDAALGVAAAMHAGTVVELDIPFALEAARYPLPPADSLIYATARRHGATLLTQDEHMEGLPGVRYFEKPRS
jgi:predicted nucleic acid-binding protein